MNVSEFMAVLQEPNKVLAPEQVKALETIVFEYPYFQAAHAVYLKALKNLDSYRYNDALKLTAAHTTDREVLFDLITQSTPSTKTESSQGAGKPIDLKNHETVAEEVTPSSETNVILGETEIDSPLPQTLKDAEKILHPELFKTSETKEEAVSDSRSSEKLESGMPFNFTKNERHSFQEWLQLTSKKPIARKKSRKQTKKQRKFELLDKFIEKQPKINPQADTASVVNIKESAKINQNQLMTETLAKVYLEQKKYKKAIQAFKILSLKYPEKSGFFADRILEVKRIQKENDNKK